ncbi:hypothetical protein [Mesorhizobium sp. M0800]|uniref:hypothetical protein n=1 Tax=Mesorhizobium sp. M0800 TaxID=2957000 RepID=UPI003338E658
MRDVLVDAASGPFLHADPIEDAAIIFGRQAGNIKCRHYGHGSSSLLIVVV